MCLPNSERYKSANTIIYTSIGKGKEMEPGTVAQRPARTVEHVRNQIRGPPFYTIFGQDAAQSDVNPETGAGIGGIRTEQGSRGNARACQHNHDHDHHEHTVQSSP